MAAKPPYLLEYRAALAAMTFGNIGPAKLIDLLDTGSVFFFEGDRKDFEKCNHCKQFLKSHSTSFLSGKTDDLPFKSDLASKLTAKGLLDSRKKLFAMESIAFVAVARREKLSCVLRQNIVFWNNITVSQAAKVECLAIEEFLAGL